MLSYKQCFELIEALIRILCGGFQAQNYIGGSPTLKALKDLLGDNANSPQVLELVLWISSTRQKKFEATSYILRGLFEVIPDDPKTRAVFAEIVGKSGDLKLIEWGLELGLTARDFGTCRCRGGGVRDHFYDHFMQYFGIHWECEDLACEGCDEVSKCAEAFNASSLYKEILEALKKCPPTTAREIIWIITQIDIDSEFLILRVYAAEFILSEEFLFRIALAFVNYNAEVLVRVLRILKKLPERYNAEVVRNFSRMVLTSILISGKFTKVSKDVCDVLPHDEIRRMFDYFGGLPVDRDLRGFLGFIDY